MRELVSISPFSINIKNFYSLSPVRMTGPGPMYANGRHLLRILMVYQVFT